MIGRWNKVLTNPNALAELIPAYEHIANASIGLSKNASTFVTNSTSYFLRPQSFNGFSNKTSAGFAWGKSSFSSNLEVMQSSTVLNDSLDIENAFYHLSGEFKRSFNKATVGLGYQNEQSAFRNDTLQSQSYGYQTYRAYIESQDTAKLNYRLSASQRYDERPKDDGFKQATIGSDVAFQSSYATKNARRIEFNTIYRQLSIEDSSLSSKDLEQTLQSRIELDAHFLKKFIRSRTFYQIGNWTGAEEGIPIFTGANRERCLHLERLR